MPLVPRRQTVGDTLSAILTTPFIFVGVNALVTSPLLLLALILFVVCRLLEGGPFFGIAPSREDVYHGLLGGAALYVLLALVTTPLALRDYFAKRVVALEWKPDAAGLAAARSLAALLIAGDYAAFAERCSEGSREFTDAEILKRDVERGRGPACRLEDAYEIEHPGIDTPPESFDDEADSFVEVILSHRDPSKRSVVTFGLDSRQEYLVEFVNVFAVSDAFAPRSPRHPPAQPRGRWRFR